MDTARSAIAFCLGTLAMEALGGVTGYTSAAVSASKSSSITVPKPTSTQKAHSKGGLAIGIIVAIVLACIVGVSICLGLCCFLMRRRKTNPATVGSQ